MIQSKLILGFLVTGFVIRETFMSKTTMGKSSAFKIQRRLGVELPGLGKAGALERRPYGPGPH